MKAVPPALRPGIRVIVLVGFMGAGKTTVGQELSRMLGWRFEDLDDLIQAREAQTIEQIFQQRGEAAFRELERTVLGERISGIGRSPLVLALGGGAFVDEQNRRILKAAGFPAVFLDAESDELYERCAEPNIARPLRRNRHHFRALYESRRPHYLNAEIFIQTSGREVSSIATEVISKLNLLPADGVPE